jgi:hypothetical protein
MQIRWLRTLAGLVTAVALLAGASAAHAAALNPQPEPPGVAASGR